MTRLVAVLGYSTLRGDHLHPIALSRLRAAERVAADGAEAVLLSGWWRRLPESELMRAAWRGPDVPLLVDPDARTTAANARAVVAAAAETGATEVIVVTSSWHARRARHLVRESLPPQVSLRVATPGRTRPLRLIARELALLGYTSAARRVAALRRRAH